MPRDPRVRGRDVESGSVGRRVIRPDAVDRRQLGARSVGRNALQPGVVGYRELGPRAVREVNVDPALIPRETFAFEPTDPAVVLCESADYPVWRGGRPMILAQLKGAPTADLVVTHYRNGVEFGTTTLEVGEFQLRVSFNMIFSPGDRARSAVTDPGADALELVVVWWLM